MIQGGAYSYSDNPGVRQEEGPEIPAMEMIVETAAAEIGYTLIYQNQGHRMG